MALDELELEGLTATRLWSALDPETRSRAAQAIYDAALDDAGGPAEADAAISRTLRFRLAAVRRLPLAKRVDYLNRSVHPDDSLASSLLRALHLVQRRDLLGAFLDQLEIPHEDGIIDSDFDFDARPPDAARLRAALGQLDSRFGSEQVDLYAMTLLVLDPGSWPGLADAVTERRGDGA